MKNDLAILDSKETITSLELLDQINYFRQTDKNKSKLLHRNLLAVIKGEFESEIGLLEIQQSTYTNKQNKEQPMYILTLDQAKQVLIKESKAVRKAVIEYINTLENKLKNSIPKQLTDAEIFKRAYENALLVEQQQMTIAIQQQQIEYKEDIIISLIDDISLAEKRQVLNRVVKNTTTGNFQERYNELYYQFDSKYRINSKKRFENYNKINKPKMKSRMEYIDKIMNKIPELYEIAVKLYENDVKELVNEMYYLNK